VVAPVEQYSPGRKAEFLLSNAIDAADYRKARIEVRKLGLDPDSIPHCDPNNGFSAATRQDAGLLRIWKLEDTTWSSSRYVLEGARINLGDEDQRTRLARLWRSLDLFEAGQTPFLLGFASRERFTYPPRGH